MTSFHGRDTGTEQGRGSAAVRAVIDSAGIAGRRLSEAVVLLTESPHTVGSLVRETTASRSAVEALLPAFGADLVPAGEGMRVRPELVAAYRDAVDAERIVRTRLDDPLAARLGRWRALVAQMDRLIGEGPHARRALAQVPATAETVVRRALWLDATYNLDGARVAFVGDYNLTSLALARVNPNATVVAADVDERVLDYIDAHAVEAGLPVRCLYTDLRFGLAKSLLEWSDLLWIDPPYTPDGLRLFLGRSLLGLRDHDESRLLMSYSFGADQVGAGLVAQRVIAELQLVYEAVLPDFSRYHGGQALGCSSDLYVLRPSARSRRLAQRAVQPRLGASIYRSGAREAPDGWSRGTSREVVDALLVAAAGQHGLPVVAVAGGGWPSGTGVDVHELGAVFVAGLPDDRAAEPYAVAVDLAEDSGSWLLRALLAIDAERVVALVPSNHPDVVSEEAWRGLARMFRPKYRLSVRRRTPRSRHAVVEADRVPTTALGAAERAARWLLDHPYDVGTGERLIDLPRRRISAVLARAEKTA